MAPRVLVVLDTSAAWSRGILRGFIAQAHAQGWTILHYHPDVDLAWLLEKLKPTVTVLGPWVHGDWAMLLPAWACISVNADRSAEGVPSICLDEERVATLALQHFLARGVRTLTSFRFDDTHFGILRERAFYRAALGAGCAIAPGWWVDAAEPARSVEDPVAIEGWLKSLPKPCGVFTCCDAWGRVVARYARSAQLRVPEDLALIGVDNDTLECELIAPPLSSVAVPWRSMGVAAVQLVRKALVGQASTGERIVVEPLEVVARRSSDTLAIDDALVRHAVTWIQAHAGRRLTVPMVAKAVNATRQRLERRFRTHLGRTVMHEVRRTHVEVAKRLLATTNLPLPEIASRSGFTNSALLNEAFRREIGLTPGEYRRRVSALVDDHG